MDLSKLSNKELLKIAKKGLVDIKPQKNSVISIPMKNIDNTRIVLDFNQVVYKEVSNQEIKDFVILHHYSHKLPNNTKINIAGYYENKPIISVSFGAPIGRNVANWLRCPREQLLELTRLSSLDELPKNTESYSIARAFETLKEKYPNYKYFVSYADTNEGHLGYIYQATNWKYIGLQPQIMVAEKYFIDGKEIHGRVLNARHGTVNFGVLKSIYGDRIEFRYGVKKHIYILCKGNKKESTSWYSQFTFLSYPKAENNILKGTY